MAMDELTVPPSALCLPANLAVSPHFFFRCGITEAIIIVMFAFYENTDISFQTCVTLPIEGCNLNASSGSSNITYL